jgi:anti-anti-sigma regulatory factor
MVPLPAHPPTEDRVVIDLGAVEFIDVAGLRVVLDAARRWTVRLSLRRAPRPAQRIFAVTATEDRLPFND